MTSPAIIDKCQINGLINVELNNKNLIQKQKNNINNLIKNQMKKIYTLIFFLVTNVITYAQWVITTGPFEPNVVTLAANDNLLIAGCSSASTNPGGFLTSNSGDNWSFIGSDLTCKFASVEINTNTGTIYAGGSNCFYQSFDNGATFTMTNNGLSPYLIRDILLDESNIYSSALGIYKSTNGGFSWSLISPVMTSNKIDKNGANIIVGTLDAGVYLSNDNGITWTNLSAGLPTNVLDVKIIGTNFLAATGSGIYVSTNNGVSWSLTNLALSTNCIYQIGSTLFAGCLNGGVHYSLDNGNTWIPSNNGLTNLTVYSLASNSDYIFAGTTGYVFRRPLSEFGILTSITNDFYTNNKINVSPNPNNGILTISQSISNKLEIEIYNQLGQIIDKKISNEKNTTLDLSNYIKGVYFVHLTDINNNIVNKKIIIQ